MYDNRLIITCEPEARATIETGLPLDPGQQFEEPWTAPDGKTILSVDMGDVCAPALEQHDFLRSLGSQVIDWNVMTAGQADYFRTRDSVRESFACSSNVLLFI